MDHLSSLPTKDDTSHTKEENEVMAKYFNKDGAAAPAKSTFKDTLKIALIVTIIFIILANPWIDSMLCIVPYCGNPLVLTAVKALIFFVVFIAVKCYV